MLLSPSGSDGKESACSAGGVGLISGSGRHPLKKGMVIHSSIVAQRIPWTKEPSGLYCLWGRTEFDITEQLTFRCNWVHKLSFQVFLPWSNTFQLLPDVLSIKSSFSAVEQTYCEFTQGSSSPMPSLFPAPFPRGSFITKLKQPGSRASH